MSLYHVYFFFFFDWRDISILLHFVYVIAKYVGQSVKELQILVYSMIQNLINLHYFTTARMHLESRYSNAV